MTWPNCRIIAAIVMIQMLYLGTAPNVPFADRYVSPASSDYEARKGSMVQYRDGDVLIGGILQVHSRGKDDTCGLPISVGVQAIETVNMVIDMINSDKEFLPGVKLGSVIVDTCDVDTHALLQVVDTLWQYFSGTQAHAATSSKLFAGVIGALSSAVSTQTTSLLQILKVPQVSPFSTHPDLSNKARFPYFFRTVPSDAYQASAMVAFVAERNWNYISIVYEEDAYGIRGYREVENAAIKRGICVAVSLAIPRNPIKEDFEEIVKELFQTKRARAVVVFSKQEDAEKLLIAAHRNLEIRGYFTWIGSDAWTSLIPTGATDFDYRETLAGSIAFAPKTNVIPSLKPYMVNLTLGQHLFKNGTVNPRNPWFPEYLALRHRCVIQDLLNNDTGVSRACQDHDRLNPDKYVSLSFMQSVAEAVLAIAKSLQIYLLRICGRASGLCSAVAEKAGTAQLAEAIAEIMKNISFTGINGDNFTFDQNQDGPAIYDIRTYQNISSSDAEFSLDSWKTIGLFDINKIVWYEEPVILEQINSICSAPCQVGQARKIETSICCWHCQTCSANQYVGSNGTECLDCSRGETPTIDRTSCQPLKNDYVKYSDSYSIASLSIASFGVIVTIVVGIIFFVHRDTPIVKASGKELCAVVLFGALLCFVNSFVLATRASKVSCSVSRILLACGPTLMYAGILTKTIRVVIIFQAKKMLSSQVKAFLLPKYQILTCFILILLQVMILSVWFLFDLPTPTTFFSAPVKSFLACNDAGDLLVLIGLAYPSLLIIACTILATINRKAPTGFNETQYIGFTMYATCVIWVAFLPIFATNSSVISLKVATLSICLSLSALTVLICLFCIRCYVIIFRPSKNTSRSVLSTTQQNRVPSVSVQRERRKESSRLDTGGQDVSKVSKSLSPSILHQQQ
ncbi:metabotropic glutamate receptor 4-like isoform X3 [Clavelina lepadiformis]